MQSNWTELLDRDLMRLAETRTAAACRSEKLVPGERREVAILFLDIEGFTSLSEDLDHETLHRLTTALMSALSRVIENYGGYVDKFEGDRVMALFGAREADEDDSTRAVTCGLRMLEMIKEIAPAFRGGGSAIGARVGVSFGSVTVAPDASGHLTAMGDEVNVASRLEDSAETNTLYTSGRVHDLCADSFAWVDLGLKAVRGRTRPVRVWRAVGLSSRQLERWQRASALKPIPLLGRDRERALLEGCWMEQESASEASIRGFPRHVIAVVQGVAGIGKSRLLHEFISSHRREMALLASRTASFDQPPWWLWTDLVRDMSGEPPALSLDVLRNSISELAAGTGPSGEALLGTLPMLESLFSAGAPGKPDGMTPEAWRSSMQVAIRNLVRARCTAGPRAVLLLEDMQWADSASREALEFLLCNCEVQVPILVLISQRSDLDECAMRLSPMTEGYVLVRTICLHPLDQEHAKAMIRLKLGFAEDAEIPGGLEERLLDRGEGNPYYIEEMLSELVGKGVLVPDGDRFALGAQPAADCMPASIAGLIRSRIDRLPTDLRRALQVASVLGAEFDEGIFSEMCRQEDIDSGAALDRLSSFRLIERRSGRHEGMLLFRSPMARDAMYENLLHHNRTVLHRRAARAMEGPDSRDAGSLSGALALHWHGGGEPVKAIRCGTGAAASLAGNYQHDEADNWIDRLEGWLPEVEEGPLRDELRLGILLVRIAVLENRMSLDLEAACSEAMPLARRLNLPVEEARAAYALGTLLVNLGRPDEARRLIESSLEVFEREDLFGRAINARFALADMLRTQGRLDEADGVIQAGLAEARRRNAPKQIASCLASLGGIRVTSGDFVEARALFSEALSIERALGQTRGLSVVLTNLGVLYGMADEIEKALECFEESMKIQVELGTRKGEGIALNNMGNCFVALGRVDEARRCFERSLLIHMETGGVKGQAVALVNLGNLAEDSGDLEGAAKNFETAIGMQRKAGNEPAAVNARCLLARIWVKQGRTDDAKTVYIESAAAVEKMNLGQAAASPVSELRRCMIREGVPEEDLPLPARWSGGGPGRQS